MKAIYILIGLVFVSFLPSFAQNIPTGIPFQGIAKDFNGNPVNERKIYIQTFRLFVRIHIIIVVINCGNKK